MKLPESIPEIANKSRASVWIIVFALLLLLFNICTGSGQTFDVPYSTTVPTIDGVLNPIEWAGSSSNVVTTIRGDKAATNTATIYFKHDGTWLYVGISSKWGYGWDVYNLLVFDGNNNHTLDGNLTEPHTDIQTQVPSPGAWSGYNRYMALLSSNNQQDVTAPSGTARASAGSTAITYEYKIALSDLGVSPGGLAGFAFMFGTDGTGQHGYYYPITVGNWIADPSQWAHVKIQNLPPTTGLVAYYPFDGNANDATGRGHDGTVHGATLTADRFGSLQNAYYFDGNGNYSGNYIEIPASSDLDNRTFTISAWAKRSSNPGAGQPLLIVYGTVIPPTIRMYCP